MVSYKLHELYTDDGQFQTKKKKKRKRNWTNSQQHAENVTSAQV